MSEKTEQKPIFQQRSKTATCKKCGNQAYRYGAYIDCPYCHSFLHERG